MQAIDRVALTARVTAFLDERLFVEGAEVQAGRPAYRLERGAVRGRRAAAGGRGRRYQRQAGQRQHPAARAQSLLNTPAGQRSNVDDAIANQRSLAAQVLSAQAQLQAAQINLAYTEIQRAGGRQDQPDQHHRGNVVTPSSGRAGDHRQPGSDVCAVPGRVPHR